MHIKKKNRISATQIIAIGFFITIVIGTLLLKLPFSHIGELSTFDALFVSTSATATVGFTPIVLIDNFTIWGQTVILLLMQIGGLGFMLIVALLLLAFEKRFTLRERLILGQAISKSSIQGLVKLTKRILIYTFLIEGIGAIIIATQLIPLYGFRQWSI